MQGKLLSGQFGLIHVATRQPNAAETKLPLFAVGNFLYGRQPLALLLVGVFAVSAMTLAYVMRGLWLAPGDRR